MAAPSKLTGRKKAAIFLISIGREISSEVMKHLREAEIEELTLEIARIEKVDPEERDRVLMEFQEMMLAQEFITQGGIEYAREVLEKALGAERAIEIINRLTSSLKVRPFDSIRQADPGQILNFIQGEHPQTISLILAYLPPEVSSQILQRLPEDMQADITRRIATMDRTSPDVIREVERILERKLSALVNEEFTTAGGVDAIVEVLTKVDRATEKSILETLDSEDPQLAEEIKKRMFVFEDITLLSDRDVQAVLREVDMKELALALKAVDETVKEKIFSNMSKRAASMLQEDMEYMGPVRLRDVEEAQQKIVNIIRKLEEQGDIVIARGGEEELVV